MTSEEVAVRIKEFRLLTVAHPMLSTAKDLLVAAINEAPRYDRDGSRTDGRRQDDTAIEDSASAFRAG